MTASDTDYQERLAAEAARLRGSGGLGRSEPLIRLFDFLLARSLEGRVPKEIEVAQAVFDKSTDFDVMQDASVRVGIHRLRRKLGEHYARSPGYPERISIPLGEYRLMLTPPQDLPEDPEPVVADDLPAQALAVSESRPRNRRFWLIVAAFALINALGWLYAISRPPIDAQPMLNNLWKPIADNNKPTLVVMGDYFIFGEAADGIAVSRLIRDFAINSRTELDGYLMLNPDKVGRYVDVGLHYLPVGSGRALRSVLPVVNAAAQRSGIRPQVETMSDVRPEIIKNLNIVYVGYLSGLGPLQEPLLRASGFQFGASYDELIDKASGRRFGSDWGMGGDGKTPQRDYGYIASLPGPAGNRILVIAGTRDPALVQMAEVAADPQQLAAIDAKSGGGSFEALFEVRTLGNLNLGSSLIVARRIRAESIWQSADAPGTGPRGKSGG